MSAVDTLREALYGNPPLDTFKPTRQGVLKAFEEVVQSLNVLSAGVIGTSTAVYAAVATLNGHLEFADRSLGLVYNDPNPDNNGVYIKSGAINTGSWTFTGLLARGPAPTDLQIASVLTPLIRDLRVNTLADETRNRIAVPARATYHNPAGGRVGSVKFGMPVAIPDARISTAKIMIVDQFGVLFFDIVGTNNAGQWDYTRSTVYGDHDVLTQHPIRFGRDANRFCFWIGDKTYSDWTYMSAFVLSATFSGNVVNEAWLGDWAISLVTDYDTVTAGPIKPVQLMSSKNPTFDGTINRLVLNSPTGDAATYCGFQAGQSITGNSKYNHLFGYQVGALLTTGFNNCGFGLQVLAEATTAEANSGFGTQALQHITTGKQNGGFGIHALLSLTAGEANNAFGAGTLQSLITGDFNTAMGGYAGNQMVTGYNNSLYGYKAGMGVNGNDNTFIGKNAGNTELGSLATVSGSIAIGVDTILTRNNEIVIGKNSHTHVTIAGVEFTRAQVVALKALVS